MSTINQLLQVAETTSKLKVIDRSRQGYASKIKYIIKFMRKYYPDSVEIDSHGIDRLKLPLKFESVAALFAQVQIDVDLPKDSKKRKKEQSERYEELMRIYNAALIRSDGDETDLPERPVEFVDTTVHKSNSVTISKSCFSGYKSALKLYYDDNKVDFSCPERPVGSQSLDDYLNTQVRSYGNIVADKKQRSVMSVTEGKCALNEEGTVLYTEC